jgi:Golgi phosphoprotein 3 (GPP34)
VLVVALTGTGLVADNSYLLAHHDVTGRPFVQPRALGPGLAGALLAELVLAGGVPLRPGGLTIAGVALSPDESARRVASLVLGEPEGLPLRDWLAFLARAAQQARRRRPRIGTRRRRELPGPARTRMTGVRGTGRA